MLNVILFATPTTGIGTHTLFISEKYNLYPIEIGDILREEIKTNTLLKGYLDSGQIVPENMIIEIIGNLINNHLKNPNTEKNGFIFTAFPKNIFYAQLLDNLLEKYNLKISIVIHLKLSEKDKKDRIRNLLELPLYDNETEQTMEKKFDNFDKELKPVIDFYEKKGELVSLNAIRNQEDIFKDICEILDKF